MSVICLTSQVTNEFWIVWTGPHIICISHCSDWGKHVAVNNHRKVSKHTGLGWPYTCALFLCQLAMASCFEAKRSFFDCRKFQCAVLFSICQKVFNLMSQSDKPFGLVCPVPRLSQLTWEKVWVLWSWQMVKQTSISCPVAKTDQVRQTFSKESFSYFGSTS